MAELAHVHTRLVALTNPNTLGSLPHLQDISKQIHILDLIVGIVSIFQVSVFVKNLFQRK